MQNDKIIIERKKRFSEARYSVGVYIDDEFIVNTLKENRQEIELSTGKHILKVQQGFRSGEIEIETKKGKVPVYHFSATSLTYFIYASFLIPFVLSYLFELRGGIEFLLYIPGILATLYTFTIGRKKYFVLEKQQEEDIWMTN